MANFTKFGINKTEIKNGLKTSVIVKTENPSLFKSFLGFKETNSTKAETNSFNGKTSKPNSKTNSNNKKQNKSLNNYEGNMPLMVFKPTEAPKKKKLSFNKKLTNTLQKLNVKKLNENLVHCANMNSFDGNRGDVSQNSYNYYVNKITSSKLSAFNKNRLLADLKKKYEPILSNEARWVSPMYSGPANYPQRKMDKIFNSMMEKNQVFVDWWKKVEDTIDQANEEKKPAKEIKEENKKEILRGFNTFYQRITGPEDVLNIKLTMHYVNKAIDVDTALYKELFEKVNNIAKFRKNTNNYKLYASVINGNISNDSVEKKKQEQNEVLYQNDVLTLKKITIQSGDRIALKFNVYPKPQLVYACKSKGFSWYYYGQCFICKPNRLNLDWVKSIREKYEKYL